MRTADVPEGLDQHEDDEAHGESDLNPAQVREAPGEGDRALHTDQDEGSDDLGEEKWTYVSE